MNTKSFNDIALGTKGLSIIHTEDSDIHVSQNIKDEIYRLEQGRKQGSLGQEKGKYEEFIDMSFDFYSTVPRYLVYVMMELAIDTINRIKNTIYHATTNEGILSRAIIYCVSRGDVHSLKMAEHLNIKKDAFYDLIDALSDRGIVEVKPDGSYKVIMSVTDQRYIDECKVTDGRCFDVLKKNMNELRAANGLRQSTIDQREAKCKLILQILNQNGHDLNFDSDEIQSKINFPVWVTKSANCRLGVIYSAPPKSAPGSKTDPYGGIKLANFLYVAYEEKVDSSDGNTYRGMVRNPYSNIDWNIHQARLTIIGHDVNGVQFKEARKNGMFATSNLIDLKPEIQNFIRNSWSSPNIKVTPADEYKFRQSHCDEIIDGIRYLNERGASYTIMYKGDTRIGLAGIKTIHINNNNTAYHNEVLYTDWIPDDPNQPYNVWLDRATKHVKKALLEYT